MSHALPGKAFADSDPYVATIDTGAIYSRIYMKRFPDPLGIGKTPSRFSDPRKRIADNRFGVLYLGSTFKVCFVEAILRDRKDGSPEFLMAEKELEDRVVVDISVNSPLKVVDLRQDGPIRMGVPSDVARGSRQSIARAWSVAIHDHKSQPDGIIYDSRLNGQTNLAIYGRSIPKLRAATTTPLLDLGSQLGATLDDLRVGLI